MNKTLVVGATTLTLLFGGTGVANRIHLRSTV